VCCVHEIVYRRALCGRAADSVKLPQAVKPDRIVLHLRRSRWLKAIEMSSDDSARFVVGWLLLRTSQHQQPNQASLQLRLHVVRCTCSAAAAASGRASIRYRWRHASHMTSTCIALGQQYQGAIGLHLMKYGEWRDAGKTLSEADVCKCKSRHCKEIISTATAVVIAYSCQYNVEFSYGCRVAAFQEI
jgi:hypothetical protein